VTKKTPEPDAETDVLARLQILETQVALLRDYTVDGLWLSLDRCYEALLPGRELTCIVCDHSDGRSGFGILTDRCIFGGGSLERYQCPKCDCIFGPMKYLDLDERFVAADYVLLYSHYSERCSTVEETRTFDSLSPQKGKVYLNWGCGRWSDTIPTLRQAGFDVWGLTRMFPNTPPTSRVPGGRLALGSMESFRTTSSSTFAHP
jgi:hypothetical protein